MDDLQILKDENNQLKSILDRNKLEFNALDQMFAEYERSSKQKEHQLRIQLNIMNDLLKSKEDEIINLKKLQ